MPNADPATLGRTLAQLRRARGWTQEQVAHRIPTYYSDAGAYGRIEREERHPDRDALAAILVHGLVIREIAEINRVLQLAGYWVLGEDEIKTLGLTQPALNHLRNRYRQLSCPLVPRGMCNLSAF